MAKVSRRVMLVAAGGLLAGTVPRRTLAYPASKRVRSELVLESATGQVLHQMAEHELIQPASLTKLMTMSMLFSALEQGRIAVDAQIVFSPRAAAMPPTRLGAAAGDSIGVGEALAALAVHSCNDVATACAEMLAGSEPAFARLMTEQAWALGMSSTNFTSASGLPDPGNVSTTRDIALLAAAIMQRHPRWWPFFGIRRWNWRGHLFSNTNHMLETFPGMDGGKTGYVKASGFNLFASAIRNNRRINAVIAGFDTAQARDDRMADLLESAFSS